LYHSFLSPFSDVPCRLQDIDFPVPTEYIINCQIKEKLAPVDPSRYSEDTLFFLFYMNAGEIMQLQAASALYDRDWRYHVEKRAWLTKVPGVEPQQKTNLFEKGIYTVFDVSQWRKTQLELTIEYNKLAKNPKLPPHYLIQQQTNSGLFNPATAAIMFQQQLQQQQQQQQGFGNVNVNSSNNINPPPTPSF
jgi:CCR4-NOT transcription complex subunit 2